MEPLVRSGLNNLVHQPDERIPKPLQLVAKSAHVFSPSQYSKLKSAFQTARKDLQSDLNDYISKNYASEFESFPGEMSRQHPQDSKLKQYQAILAWLDQWLAPAPNSSPVWREFSLPPNNGSMCMLSRLEGEAPDADIIATLIKDLKGISGLSILQYPPNKFREARAPGVYFTLNLTPEALDGFKAWGNPLDARFVRMDAKSIKPPMDFEIVRPGDEQSDSQNEAMIFDPQNPPVKKAIIYLGGESSAPSIFAPNKTPELAAMAASSTETRYSVSSSTGLLFSVPAKTSSEEFIRQLGQNALDKNVSTDLLFISDADFSLVMNQSNGNSKTLTLRNNPYRFEMKNNQLNVYAESDAIRAVADIFLPVYSVQNIFEKIHRGASVTVMDVGLAVVDGWFSFFQFKKAKLIPKLFDVVGEHVAKPSFWRSMGQGIVKELPEDAARQFYAKRLATRELFTHPNLYAGKTSEEVADLLVKTVVPKAQNYRTVDKIVMNANAPIKIARRVTKLQRLRSGVYAATWGAISYSTANSMVKSVQVAFSSEMPDWVREKYHDINNPEKQRDAAMKDLRQSQAVFWFTLESLTHFSPQFIAANYSKFERWYLSGAEVAAKGGDPITVLRSGLPEIGVSDPSKVNWEFVADLTKRACAALPKAVSPAMKVQMFGGVLRAGFAFYLSALNKEAQVREAAAPLQVSEAEYDEQNTSQPLDSRAQPITDRAQAYAAHQANMDALRTDVTYLPVAGDSTSRNNPLPVPSLDLFVDQVLLANPNAPGFAAHFRQLGLTAERYNRFTRAVQRAGVPVGDESASNLRGLENLVGDHYDDQVFKSLESAYPSGPQPGSSYAGGRQLDFWVDVERLANRWLQSGRMEQDLAGQIAQSGITAAWVQSVQPLAGSPAQLDEAVFQILKYMLLGYISHDYLLSTIKKRDGDLAGTGVGRPNQ